MSTKLTYLEGDDVHAGVRMRSNSELIAADIGSAFNHGEIEMANKTLAFVSMRVAPIHRGEPHQIYELIWASPESFEKWLKSALKAAHERWPGQFVDEVKR